MNLASFERLRAKNAMPAAFVNQMNVERIITLSFIMFSGFTLLYSYLVFQQFSFIEILATVSLYCSFAFICFKGLGLKVKLSGLTGVDVVCALITVFILVILMTIPLGIHHADYFRTFPLVEAEQGVGTVLRGWYDDTVFHTAIIQSILNSGYPSIGQHGMPLMVYHVISHYFDALILKITAFEPFDSYGFFAVLKRFLLLSALSFLVAKISIRKSPAYLFGIVLFIPLSIDMWLPVISHGLWLPTVIFIITLPYVFGVTFDKSENSLLDFIGLFFVALLISFGKVSFGFLYAAFIGFVLLVKQPKCWLVYVLGIAWIVFFLVYSVNMPIQSSMDHGLSIDNLTLSAVINYFTNSHWAAYGVIFLILPALFCFRKLPRESKYYLFSGAIISVITLVISIATSLGPADKVYFQLAMYTILLSFGFVLISYKAALHTTKSVVKLGGINLLPVFFICVTIFYLSMNKDTLFDRMLSRNAEPFRVMNNSLLQINQSLTSALMNVDNRGWFISSSGGLSQFRERINEALEEQGAVKAESRLFLSKEVYSQLPHDYGDKWAAGMFLYSLTGVPMLNAIKDEPVRGYGIFQYDTEAKRKSKSDFSIVEACDSNDINLIITVESYSPLEVLPYRCDSYRLNRGE
ncbi:hypothetical protein LRP50_04435 [Enterovibrio sp. ZSDZ42]|uniref:Glycosyltransferase RgtA/B/C/D-like domain-containing protein n=1 Tax=Enterovibrio gelatinilyticus TaxID=2899819 RepID=A0ABT5QYL3_9GAMM|nr:hypothetical protein [Enterovibrio sp. ZSDZ42]MDD1792372.1 hypothetical protein [Enterovibrio sp. ZSDZ42]